MAVPIIALAGLGLAGAGLGYSIFGGGGGVEAPNIDREMANIRDLYARARAQAAEDIKIQYASQKVSAASDLAGRGTYRAPVAENVFNALRVGAQQATASAQGKLYGEEADTQSKLLSALTGASIEAQKYRAQQDAAFAGQLGAFGGSLIQNSKMFSTTPRANAPASNLLPPGGGVMVGAQNGGSVMFPGRYPVTSPFAYSNTPMQRPSLQNPFNYR